MKPLQKTLVRIIFIVLAIALVIPLASCTQRKPWDGELPQDYKPEVRGKIKVSCINHLYTNEESQRGVRAWINAFCRKYPDVQVQTEFNIPDYAPLISSKTLGDLFYISDGGLTKEDSLYQYAVTNQTMMPLDFYVEAYGIDLDEVYGGILDLCIVDGKLYMAGYTCGNVIFTYNVDAMVEAGILEPGERLPNDWTWEKFKDVCEQLKIYDVDGRTLTQVGCCYDFSWSNLYSPFLYAYGGDWFDKENKKVSLDNEAVRQGIREAIYMIDNRLAKPLGVSMNSDMQKEFSKVNPYNGCVLNYNASYTVLTENVKQYPKGTEWDVVAYPLFPYAASPCGALGFSVFSYTRNKDAAAALALFLLTEDGQRAIHGQAGGDVPLLKKLGGDEFWHLTGDGYEDKNYDAFTANYERYVPGQISACVPPEITSIIQSGISKMFSNYCSSASSWEDQLALIQEQCNQMWDNLYNG
ncbi:MAG: ABC transporter substrate-binding protein [Clostridia bacterium]|nr:ABC transporter substrate-binding protein [Clostridia bacterium]